MLLISVLFIVSNANAQSKGFTSETDAKVLCLLILPGSMRDNNVNMWIHITRPGDPDPLAQQFGKTSGYLIFTDMGDRIERAVFGDAGAVENIDVQGSQNVALAFSGYHYNNPWIPGRDLRFPMSTTE